MFVLEVLGNEERTEELTQRLVARRKQIDLLCAQEAADLQQWDANKVWTDDGSKSAGHRLSRESRSSIAGCKRLVYRAKRLVLMPLTSQAFASGKLSVDRVDQLVMLNKREVEDLFARDEALLVHHAKKMVWPDFVKFCNYWRMLADDERGNNKGNKAFELRSLYVSRTTDGAVDIRGLLDPINGEIFINGLMKIENEFFKADWAEAIERLGDGITTADLLRTNAQRRADAVVEMAKRAHSSAPGDRKPEPLLSIMAGEATFAKTCELASGTVLSPSQLVPLLTSADIERIVFDGPSRVMDVGQARSFTGALARALRARDGRCQDPSVCDIPAVQCELDHDHPWSLGGETCEANGKCMCGFHNRRKGNKPKPKPPPPDDD